MDRSRLAPTFTQALDRTLGQPARRAFLQRFGGLAALGSASGWALNLAAIGQAAAQSNEDYRALVCVFLAGGNDNANTVVPYDTVSYNTYAAARATPPTPIARARESLVQIRPRTPLPDGRQIALPTELARVRTLFEQGRAALIANVGPLVVPTTLAQYRAGTVPLPPKLFSHNDQQSVWQSLAPEGAPSGWGGRFGDLMLSRNSQAVFTSISAAGAAVWASGQQTIQFQVNANDTVTVSINGATGGTLFGSSSGPAALRSLITGSTATTSQALMKSDHAAVVRRSLDANAQLASALAAAPPISTAFPSGNTLADQLKAVARIISARGSLGMRRQTFFVSLGGFDNHDNLTATQPGLHATLDAALGAFHDAMVELGISDKVTAFTASDFGRTLTSNGDGSDHGWGSHHIVLGGAVKGAELYGTFPRVELGTPEDVGQGRLLPSTSVDQYAATLATWYGVSATDLATVLPNLTNFGVRHLGFL